jgi:hypothetical protein
MGGPAEGTGKVNAAVGGEGRFRAPPLTAWLTRSTGATSTRPSASMNRTACSWSNLGSWRAGLLEIRAALAGFIALKPTLQTEMQRVIEAADLTLYLGRWKLRGTDPAGLPVLMGGDSVDVLRRQPDGRWLIALDNPWGVQLLDAS